MAQLAQVGRRLAVRTLPFNICARLRAPVPLGDAAASRCCGHFGGGCPSPAVRSRWSSTAGTTAEGASGGLVNSLAAGDHRRFVFVGGKGGVGKTTTAAALAVRLAKSGRKTLVVSTDPAHSLGDALALSLTGTPRRVQLLDEPAATQPHAEDHPGGLFAMEIDPAEAVEELRRALKLDQLRAMIRERRGGIGAGLLAAMAQAGLDLESVATLLDLSPPGIDEAVALVQIMQLLSDRSWEGFERVVIDTAPTGHTLRLLAFPQFLHGLIAAILSLNEKVAGFTLLPRLLGQFVGDDLNDQLKVSKAHLERLMAAMGSLNALFADAGATTFVVVTIPTHLAVAESRRLLRALQQAQMPARHIVVNQCPFISVEHGSDEGLLAQTASAKASAGLEAAGLSIEEADCLRRTLGRLFRQQEDARRQVRILENEVSTSVRIFRMPVFDEELTGPAALDRYAAALDR